MILLSLIRLILMNIFNYIKSHLSILDVISEHTTLKKNGSYWKGCCPFHHEKTASFTVSPHKEIFYCFGCHVSGDSINFIEKIEHCTPIEAVHYLAQRFNIVLPEEILKQSNNAGAHGAKQQKNLYFTLCKLMAIWCQQQLEKNSLLLEYLQQRGFDTAIIHQFLLGYFPAGASAIALFIAYMQTHAILTQDLLDAQILMLSKQGSGKQGLYCPFEDRLIFPIRDYQGNFCGFGGRVFKPQDERPKYYNSKENEFFLKGALLFGLDSAKKSMQETGVVFLVEGYTDCMAMVQHGFSNTVATLGTACTPQHLKTVSRFVQQVYVLYDNDSAGQQAIMRLTQLCWQVDLELKVISLPKGQDPASWLQNNSDIQSLMHSAKDIFLFFIDMLGNNVATKLISEKMRLVRQCIEIIKTINDPLRQNFLLQKAAKVFDIPFASLQKELLQPHKPLFIGDHEQKQEHKNEIVGQVNHDSIEAPFLALEKQFFCAIIQDVSLLNNVNVKYIIDCLPQKLSDILSLLNDLYVKQQSHSLHDLLYLLNPADKKLVHKLIFEQSENIVDTIADNTINSIAKNDLETLLNQLQKIHWKKIVHDIKVQIAHADSNKNRDEVEKLIQEFIFLKKKMVSQTF